MVGLAPKVPCTRLLLGSAFIATSNLAQSVFGTMYDVLRTGDKLRIFKWLLAGICVFSVCIDLEGGTLVLTRIRFTSNAGRLKPEAGKLDSSQGGDPRSRHKALPTCGRCAL